MRPREAFDICQWYKISLTTMTLALTTGYIEAIENEMDCALKLRVNISKAC